MSDAHENFCAEIAAALVVPRRNIRRGLLRITGEESTTPIDYDEAALYLRDAFDGIRQVEERIEQEETRTIHTCSCGHSHYRHGEAT